MNQYTFVTQDNSLLIENSNLSLRFDDSQLAVSNFASIEPMVTQILTNEIIKIDRKNRPFIQKLINNFNKSRDRIYYPKKRVGYATRLYSKHTDISQISINIETDDYLNQITMLEFLYTSIFPDIVNHVNTYNPHGKIETLEYRLNNNILTINGSIANMYAMLVKNQVKPIIEDLRNSQYTLDEFNNNLTHFKNTSSNQTYTCTICLGDIDKNSIVTKTKCNHYFHYHCIHEYFIKTNSRPCCPNCRTLQTRGVKKHK